MTMMSPEGREATRWFIGGPRLATTAPRREPISIFNPSPGARERKSSNWFKAHAAIGATDRRLIEVKLTSDRGYGLFAVSALEKWQFITEFPGVDLSHHDALVLRACKAPEQAYLITIAHGHVDRLCRDTPTADQWDLRGCGQMANGTNDRKHKPNARKLVIENTDSTVHAAVLQATRRIEAGEEIVYAYGKGSFHCDHATHAVTPLPEAESKQ